MNLFGSLKDFAKGIGQERSEHVIGVDVGSSSIKIVELKPGSDGKPALQTYGEILLGPLEGKASGEIIKLPPDQIARAVRELIAKAGVTTNNAGVALPFSSSLITVVPVPVLSDEQLAELVPIEARKYIPVPMSEIYLDWQRITSQGGGESAPQEKVLLFAIHKSAVETYQTVVALSNLDATFYELEIFSTLRSSIGVTEDPIIVADIGAGYTKLYIARSGEILASRKLNVGGASLSTSIAKTFSIPFSKAEEMKRAASLSSPKDNVLMRDVVAFYTDIVDEVQKLRDGSSDVSEKPIQSIVLAGGASLMNGLPEFISDKTSLECRRVLPWDTIDTPAFLENLIEETGPEFCVAIGLALRKLASRE